MGIVLICCAFGVLIALPFAFTIFEGYPKQITIVIAIGLLLGLLFSAVPLSYPPKGKPVYQQPIIEIELTSSTVDENEEYYICQYMSDKGPAQCYFPKDETTIVFSPDCEVPGIVIKFNNRYVSNGYNFLYGPLSSGYTIYIQSPSE